jgi:fused signal recognition particle receptor
MWWMLHFANCWLKNRKIEEACWRYPMVFNWFNRFKKQEKKPEAEPTPPEAPIEVSAPPGEAEPYYMRLAKEIQRKEEQKVEELPAAEPNPVAELNPVAEPLKAEAPIVTPPIDPPKVEIKEEIFDWQKILYGSNAPSPVIDSFVEPPTPISEKPPELTAEVFVPAEVVFEPTPVVEVPMQIPVPVIEQSLEAPIPEATSDLPTPAIEKSFELPTPELIAEVPTPVIEQPQETFVETPLPFIETFVEASTTVTEKPYEPDVPETIAEVSASFIETPLETIPEVPEPEPESAVLELPAIEPINEVNVPTETSTPPAPQPNEPAIPFWKRILGQRPPTTPTPTVPEAPPALREKPTAEPQPAQFDAGFLWSAEVLAAQGRRPEDVTLEEISWLQKLRTGLGRTRRGLVNNLKAIVGRGPLGPQEIEELEELLLQADVGIGVSEKILESLQVRVRQEALPPDQAMTFLKNQLRQQVELKGDDPAKFAPLRDQLNIWLVVGVNGVGKTTTIGKLASLASRSGYRTMIAAGDTFRAGAVSQVQIWAERSNVPVISNPSPNADPASVVFDAIGAARARNIELLIVDTAGRLQNKKNLMDELAKIRRIIDKQGVGAHVESLLVLDSTTGQNGLQQAKVFTEVASLTGVVLTKLDGSAKGGIALAIVDELKLPIRFVGVGEKVDDLRPFNSYEFIEALLSDVED